MLLCANGPCASRNSRRIKVGQPLPHEDDVVIKHPQRQFCTNVFIAFTGLLVSISVFYIFYGRIEQDDITEFPTFSPITVSPSTTPPTRSPQTTPAPVYTTNEPTVQPTDASQPELQFAGMCATGISCKFKLCEGHCRADSDCDVGLACFQRVNLESILGCLGLGINGMNYCYLPQDPILFSKGNCTGDLPCGMCEGKYYLEVLASVIHCIDH
jgi:hypothetical protein